MTEDIPAKSPEEYFRDWHSSVFSFGYGSGEEHWIPALKDFMACLKVRDGRYPGYDYQVIEAKLGPLAGWLMINTLCGADIIEYGTSPRFGWLSLKGQRLRAYMDGKTAEELYDIAMGEDDEYIGCSPDACNCGPNGWIEGRKCPNPFWCDVA
jgi:hypothetical protein